MAEEVGMEEVQSVAMASALSDVALVMAVLAAGAFVLWLAVSEVGRRHQLARVLAFRLKVLDKLSAVDAESTARVVTELVRADEAQGIERGARAAQIGVVALATACGSFGLMAFNVLGVQDAWLALGVLAASLGAGFLGAAMLARRWRS
jgi:hypothetical protein